MRFWDSSALVPLLIEEKTTASLLEVYPGDDVVAWWGSEIECASAVARLEREGNLAVEDATESFRRLRALAASWILVEPTDSVKEIAKRFLRNHDLRAADSLQLAAATVVAEQRPATLEVVCLDRRLGVAAQREGFEVIAWR